MSKIMVRKGRDDLEALLTAQAMEKAGATVISITYDGEHKQQGAMIPCSRFCVFCRVPDGLEIDRVDEFIDHALFPSEYPDPAKESK